MPRKNKENIYRIGNVVKEDNNSTYVVVVNLSTAKPEHWSISKLDTVEEIPYENLGNIQRKNLNKLLTPPKDYNPPKG